MAVRESNLDQKIFASSVSAGDRGPSPVIWDDCPVLEYTHNPLRGFHWFDDFKVGAYALATNQALTKLTDAVYGFTGNDAANTITQPVTTHTGEIVLNTGVSNVGTTLLMLCQSGAGGVIELPVNKKFWLEARMKCDLAANSKAGFFFGVVDKALGSAAGIIAIDGTMADVNHLGFHVAEDDYDTINCIWKNKGVAVSAEVANGDAAGTLVTSTYTKLGIYGDGKSLQFFQDGKQIFKTGDSAHSATTFPNVAGENMCLALATMGAATQAVTNTLDWVKFAREF